MWTTLFLCHFSDIRKKGAGAAGMRSKIHDSNRTDTNEKKTESIFGINRTQTERKRSQNGVKRIGCEVAQYKLNKNLVVVEVDRRKVLRRSTDSPNT